MQSFAYTHDRHRRVSVRPKVNSIFIAIETQWMATNLKSPLFVQAWNLLIGVGGLSANEKLKVKNDGWEESLSESGWIWNHQWCWSFGFVRNHWTWWLIVFKSLTENGAKSLWQLAELRAKSPFSDHLNIPGYKCRKGACQWTSSAGDELLLLFLLLCWADHADDGATWLKRWIHGRWDIAELLGKLSAWGIVLNSSRALGAEAWLRCVELCRADSPELSVGYIPDFVDDHDFSIISIWRSHMIPWPKHIKHPKLNVFLWSAGWNIFDLLLVLVSFVDLASAFFTRVPWSMAERQMFFFTWGEPHQGHTFMMHRPS